MATQFQKTVFNWVICLLISYAPMAHADHSDGNLKAFKHDLNFSSSSLPFSLKATRRLKQLSDGRWSLEVKAKNWLGEIRETTFFQWHGCIPQTETWKYHRQGLGKEREAIITLDHENKTAISVKGKRKREYEIGEHTTDQLSQTLALQCLLQQPHDGSLSIDVADERGRKTAHYSIGKEEWIETRQGKIKALPLTRVRAADSDRQTMLWFAPDHQYALIRLVQIEDDKRLQMDLASNL